MKFMFFFFASQSRFDIYIDYPYRSARKQLMT